MDLSAQEAKKRLTFWLKCLKNNNSYWNRDFWGFPVSLSRPKGVGLRKMQWVPKRKASGKGLRKMNVAQWVPGFRSDAVRQA